MALTTNETVMLLIITLILLVAGMLLDAISIFMIFVPMLMPVVKAYGWDPTWFGIIVTMNLAIGSFTPPMAVNLMVTCRIAGCTIESTTRWVLWMVAAMGTSLLLVTFVPEVALFLPRWAGAL
jgi:TRAP-type C4-dicarboxylate transport system permease large subunit